MLLYGLLIITLNANGLRCMNIDALDKITNEISAELKTPQILMIPYGNTIDFEGGTNASHQWNDFVAVLVNVTMDRIGIAKNNIINNYDLSNAEVESVEKTFKHAHEDYQQFLQFNFKKSIETKTFNLSRAYMLDFMDLSNYLFGQIIEYNLAKVKGKLNLATKWYQQSMRQKIARQQEKIGSNYIEAHICYELELCKERKLYSQYLVEWVRHYMGLEPPKIKKLFSAIPEVIEKNIHKIKSNTKFKKTLKSIDGSSVGAQRDTLDYIDEILTDRDSAVHFAPDHLRKGAILLTNLFTLIDENYHVNDDDVDELEDITEMIQDFVEENDGDIKKILNDILENMVTKLKEFKLDVKRRLDVIWSQIILL